MMKKTLLFLLLVAFSSNMAIAQITVDAEKSDWAEIPILSEPGVFPYSKVLVTSTHVYYMLEVEDVTGERIDTDASGSLVGVIDADNSKDTGQNHWVYPFAGLDYQLTNTFHYFGGSDMVWVWYPIERAVSSSFAEAGFEIAKMTTIPDQPEVAKIALASTFGLGIRYNKEGADTYHPLNNWDFAERKVFTVKPRTTLALNSAAGAVLQSSNAYYMPFMKDAEIASYLDFQSGGYSSQNPQHWASWSVDLVDPGKYNVKMTHQSADGGKIKFALVDITSNAVVFETTDDIWYATHADGFEEKSLTTLDLSAVPAGKYMLKITNPTTWGAYLKVKELSLENDSPTTGIASNNAALSAVKIFSETKGIAVLPGLASKIEVFAVNGMLMGSNIVNKDETYRLSLNPGIYIVKINSELGTVSRKVIVN